MSRSRLFSLLKSSFRASEQSDEDAISTGSSISRRELLTGAAGLAGLSALGWSVGAQAAGTKPAPSAGPDVLVIGAGLSGLTCSWLLQRNGVNVTLLEAAKSSGGRIQTVGLPAWRGAKAEIGGEFIDTGHKTMFGLVKALNLTLLGGEEKLATDRIRLFDEKAGRIGETVFIGDRIRSMREVEREIRKIAKKIKIDYPAGSEVSYKNTKLRALDEMPMSDYLASLKTVKDPVSDWLIEFLEVAYVSEFGLDAKEQSSLNLLSLIRDGIEPGKFSVYGDSDEAFRVRGGNDQVVNRLQARLGPTVRTGWELLAIRKDSAGTYICTFKVGDGTQELRAPSAVLALPFTMLRKVDLSTLALRPVKRKAIAELGYGTNVKALTGFDGWPWRDEGRSGTVFASRPFNEFWDATRGDPAVKFDPDGVGVLTSFVGGSDGVKLGGTAPTAARSEILAKLGGLYIKRDAKGRPFADRAVGETLIAAWPTAPQVLGSYSCYKPGQWTTIAGCEGEREPGEPRLMFCGEHTSSEAQGYMEGAAESGARAAREVLAVLRKPARVRL